MCPITQCASTISTQELVSHLSDLNGTWRFAVEVSSRPGVELSDSSLRIELDANSVVVLPVPTEAQPVDLSSASCTYSRKRGELIVTWPRAGKKANGDNSTEHDGILSQLENYRLAFAEIQNTVNAIKKHVTSGLVCPSKGRDDLAQLEAKLERLQCCGVDSLETSHLQGSDKETARDTKKEMTDSCEALQKEIDSIFRMLQHPSTPNTLGDEPIQSCSLLEDEVSTTEASEPNTEESTNSGEEEEELPPDTKQSGPEDPALSTITGESGMPSPSNGSLSSESACLAESPSRSLTESFPSEEVSSSSVQSQVDAVPAKSVDEWKALGNEAVKSGDHASAVECYSAGLNIDANHVLLLSNRALCLHKLGRAEDALLDANRCAELRPDFVKGFLRGALILRELGRPQEALELLRKAPLNDEVEKLSAEVRPEAEAAEARRIAALTGAERKKEEGNALFKKGLFEQALQVYSDALALCSDPSGEMALAIRNNRAGCYHQLSNFELVVEEANVVLAQQPHNLKALVRRMIALEPLEKYEAALEDARRVLSYAPGNEQANRVQHRLSKLVRDLKRDRDNCA